MLPRSSLKHTRQRFSMTSELTDDEHPIVYSRMICPTDKEMFPEPMLQAPTRVYVRPEGKGDDEIYLWTEAKESMILPRPLRPVCTTSIPNPYYQDTEWRARATARTEEMRRRSHKNVVAAAGGGVVVILGVMMIFVVLGTQKVI